LCLDDENVQSILPLVKRRPVTYGRSSQSDFQPYGIEHLGSHTNFSVRTRRGDLGSFHLNIPGDHNVLNATAAIAVALELHVDIDVIRQGLRAFTGVARRFDVKGEVNGVTVVDDYGHHPTEIRATLAAARSVAKGNLTVLFQPHRYTRTQHLMDEFARAFHDAGRVVVLDIYAASEKPVEGVTSQALVDRMRQFGHRGAEYASSAEAGVAAAMLGAAPGDMIVTLGAGSVSGLAPVIVEKLNA
jgi:UDP-N-acetylmuramate--alanine ligase